MLSACTVICKVVEYRSPVPTSPLAGERLSSFAVDVVDGLGGFRRQLAVDEAHVATKIRRARRRRNRAWCPRSGGRSAPAGRAPASCRLLPCELEWGHVIRGRQSLRAIFAQALRGPTGFRPFALAPTGSGRKTKQGPGCTRPCSVQLVRPTYAQNASHAWRSKKDSRPSMPQWSLIGCPVPRSVASESAPPTGPGPIGSSTTVRSRAPVGVDGRHRAISRCTRSTGLRRCRPPVDE